MPLNAPDNSFIFSKDKSLKIKDKDIQAEFNKAPKGSGYAPAEIAKQYDINKYRKTLADEASDKLQRDTAEKMIENYNMKLGKLALVQESMKGMPDGVPFISVPYLTEMGIDPALLVSGNQDETEVPTMQEEDDTVQKKMGGDIKLRILKKPKFAVGGQEDGIDPFKSKTEEGRITPTLANSDSPLTAEQYAEYYKKHGIDISNLTSAEAQAALYDKANPFVKALVWGKFGDTKHGATKSKHAEFAMNDKEDFNSYKNRLLTKYGSEENLNKELSKLKTNFTDGKSGARTASLLLNVPQPKTEEPGPLPTDKKCAGMTRV